MPQTRQNGGIVPVGSDPYALTQDLATLADSLNVDIIVSTLEERNALTPHEGMRVVRLDLSGITETYINGAWSGSGATNIATFGASWTPLTGGHAPRVYRSGGIVFLVGGVTIGAGADPYSNILTIPTQFRPSTTGTMFVGSGVSSNAKHYELALANGVLSIPTGYIGGGTDGGNFPVTSQWPLY